MFISFICLQQYTFRFQRRPYFPYVYISPHQSVTVLYQRRFAQQEGLSLDYVHGLHLSKKMDALLNDNDLNLNEIYKTFNDLYFLTSPHSLLFIEDVKMILKNENDLNDLF